MSICIDQGDDTQVIIAPTEQVLNVTEDACSVDLTIDETGLVITESATSLSIDTPLQPSLSIREHNTLLEVQIATVINSNSILITTGASIEGSGTAADPLVVAQDVLDTIDGKLDEDYAHHKSVTATPPMAVASGETVHYTYQYLVGAIKVTEHRIRTSDGEDTVVKTVTEAI